MKVFKFRVTHLYLAGEIHLRLINFLLKGTKKWNITVWVAIPFTWI